MSTLVPLLAAAAAAVAADVIWMRSRHNESADPMVFLWVSVVLPFAAGGFHTYISMITVVVLTGNLVWLVRKNKRLVCCCNLSSAALAVVTGGYCLCFLWAADRGMAVFAVVRYLPVLLYALTLMQYTPAERECALKLLPVSGAAMTTISCLLLLIPGMENYVTVNGRLSGFLQYPNTFAAFLLAGLILSNSKALRGKQDAVVDMVLIVGIVLSGSRTGFLLLAVTLLGILWIHKESRRLLMLAGSLGIGLVLALAATRMGVLRNADRFASISGTAGTFLVRLLYYKDAVPVILKHPLGVGYMGYRAVQGTFQTGRYNVSFVHNGFLQLLLDIGWFPALLLAAALLRALFSRHTPAEKRLLLFVVLSHCMLDFDLQFFLIWVILLSSMELDSGRKLWLRKGKTMGAALCTLQVLLCLWLGTGDLLYSTGRTQACLALTPFHTDALSSELLEISAPDKLDAAADRILELNPTHSLAASAKANAAFSQGKIGDMIRWKEMAIGFSPYAEAEYCDYFEKLYTTMQMYLQAGDEASAYYCAKKLCGIPEMMERISERTDPLAYRTGDDMLLTLPKEYRLLLEQIQKRLHP